MRALVGFLANEHIPSFWLQRLVPAGHVTKARPTRFKLEAGGVHGVLLGISWPHTEKPAGRAERQRGHLS